MLVEEWTAGGEEDREYDGIGIWIWDAQKKHYRFWDFNNRGTVASGTATYDEEAKTWRTKGSQTDWAGTTTFAETTITMPDANTQVVTGESWPNAWKLRKLSEWKATGRRK